MRSIEVLRSERIWRTAACAGLGFVSMAACDDSFDAVSYDVSITPVTEVYRWPYHARLEDEPDGPFVETDVIDDDDTTCGLNADWEFECHTEYDDDYAGFVKDASPLQAMIGDPIDLSDPASSVRFPHTDLRSNTEVAQYTREHYIDFVIRYDDGAEKEETCTARIDGDSFRGADLEIIRSADTVRYEDKVAYNYVAFHAEDGVYRVAC